MKNWKILKISSPTQVKKMALKTIKSQLNAKKSRNNFKNP